MHSREALVMISGGQDSLALLHLLATGALGACGPTSLHALHVNHHLRGAESEADQALVEECCRTFGVSLSVVDAPVDKYAGNVQAAARRARREAAFALLGRSGASVAAVAHTLDDQVETLLYRLGRYGGLRALAGMSPNDPPWVRPFLGVRREETAAYCGAHGLEYAVDRGNEHPGYARTGLRQRVVPAWEEALPGAVAAAGRAAEVAAEAYEVLREAVGAALSDVAPGSPPDGRPPRELSVARLLRLSSALRRAVLHAVLEGCMGEGASRALVLDVEGFLSGERQAVLALGGGWSAERVYGRLLLVPPVAAGTGAVADAHTVQARAQTPPAVPLACPGEVEWGGLVLGAEPVSSYRAHDPRMEAYLDAAAVAGSLWVRGVRSGDKMRPLGAPGDRLLQDILVDLKVPRHLRRRVPVIGCGERIVWLAGYVLADEGRIDVRTRRLVRLSVRERNPQPGSHCPEGGVHQV
ncbi:MAG: tRNA lysidine(34) synthetase TilS [Thermoleophilia bacterium]